MLAPGRGRGKSGRLQDNQQPSPGGGAAATRTETVPPGGAQDDAGQLHLRLQRLPDRLEQLNVGFPRLTRHESGVDLTESRELAHEHEREPLYLAEKRGRGRLGTPLSLSSNMYVLQPEPGKKLYRYEVEILELKGPLAKDITKGAKNDAIYVEKRNLCMEIFVKLFSIPEGQALLGANFFSFVYDRARILYSVNELGITEAGKTFVLDVGLFENNREYLSIDDRVKGYQVKIKAVTDGFCLQLDEYAADIDPDLHKRDRVVVQVLELATTQIVQFNRNHVLYGNKAYKLQQLGPNDDLGSGRFLGHGFQKSVRVVEGEGTGGPVPVMQVDVKKSAFWKGQSALDTVAEMLEVMQQRGGQNRNPRQRGNASDRLLRPLSREDKRKLSNCFVKGLLFVTCHTNRRFESNGLSKENAGDIDLKMKNENGKEYYQSLVQYFRQKYNYDIKYPNLPCIQQPCPGRSEPNYYPLELCVVADFQRVEIKKQTEEQMQQMIKASAQKPADRKREIENEMAAAELKDNDFLRSLAIETASKPLNVEGRKLPKPKPVYGGNAMARPRDDTARWNDSRMQFVEPAKCYNWVVAVFMTDRGWPLPRDVFRNWLQNYVRRARQCGMDIGEPSSVDELAEDISVMKTYFGKWSKDNVQFILFVSRPSGRLNVHDHMKLLERDYQIVTQHVLSFTITNKNDDGTLHNVIKKSNLKMGGNNYRLELDHHLTRELYLPGRVFIGYDVNHPPPLSREQQRRGEKPKEPSVVGMSMVDNMAYSGSIDYQEARMEKVVTILKDMAAEHFAIYRGRHPGTAPSEIVIIRDGVSEGQLAMLLEVELPQFHAAYSDVFKSGTPKVLFMTAEKRNPMRLFLRNINPRGKPAEQNIPSGTVLDHTLVHPTTDEFYLNSHTAIQGTAKVPRYQTLLDEIGLSSDQKQMIVMGLAYNHQIVSQPVSLPSVAYDAHELAKRGKNNFRAFQEREEGTSGVDSACSFSTMGEGGEWDRERLKVQGLIQSRKFQA